MVTATCKICGSFSKGFGEVSVLERYIVTYFRCERCGFVQTEDPYWLDEAYASALIAADVGAVRRNMQLAETTQAIIQHLFDPGGRFLDYGGGYGLFVRLMRDRGLDFRWRDRYAANLYSMGFEPEAGNEGFELVTAFEVLEHLVDPVADVGEMLLRGDSLLFSTELLPSWSPRPGEWWYYAPFGGQHVAIYTRASLEALGERFGARLASDGRSTHLLSRRPVSEAAFRLLSKLRVARIVNVLRRRSSLIPADHALMIARGARAGARPQHESGAPVEAATEGATRSPRARGGFEA
jgi:hypothetical protein